MLNSTTRSSHTHWLGNTLVIELILTMITYKVDVIYSVASVLYSTCQFVAAPPSSISARTKHMSKNKNRKRKITIKLRTLQATKKIWFPSICFKFEKQEETIDHFLYIAKWDSRLSPIHILWNFSIHISDPDLFNGVKTAPPNKRKYRHLSLSMQGISMRRKLK